VFSKPSIKELLGQYTLVQLYTDAVPPHFQPTTSADENRQLLNDVFGTAQLPTYVILKPLGESKYKEVGRYDEGKINNVPAFAQFLQKPLAGIGGDNKVAAAGL
jgi:hypothetical protein